MKSIHFIFSAFLGIALILHSSFAQDTGKQSNHAVAMTDEQSIEQVMKSLFDKPEAPLKVAAVSIEGVYAVAGWIQSERGGRALLKKESGKWSIQVCGGDSLKQAKSLVLTGMDQSSASNLAKKIISAEKKLPIDQVKKFAMFEGVVKVGPGAHHPNNTAHGHAEQIK